jgi:hypothetical protein
VWVDAKRSEIQAYARSCILNEACENTVDLWAQEAVIHRIDARRREIDQQTDDLFDAKGIALRRDQRLAELAAAADEQIAAESARLDEMVARRLAELRHDSKVKIFEAENDAHSHTLTSAIRSSKAPKPSPIASRTRSKGKSARKPRILDLDSHASGTDTETPMSTEDEGPPPPAPNVSTPESASPAEPTPKAHSFSRSEAPSPPSRPTSTTPTGPPALTPPCEPASELTMVLAALSNMKTSLSEEINKVNARVDQLILNPPGVVPSSQPFDDFGDFSLPTAEDHMDAEDFARYSTAEEESRLESLYFDLARILHSSGRCPPIQDHDIFADFLSRFLRELHWPLTPATFTAEQLDHCAKLWNVRCNEETAIVKAAQDRDLFDDLFGGNAPRSTDDLQKFSGDIDRFCSKYKMSRPIPDSTFVFLKEFLTVPPPPAPKPKAAARVRFSEPPIATLNPTPDPPSTTTNVTSEDFPALAGKPFGDSWTTVTKRGKKKKSPQSSNVPSPTKPAPMPAPSSSSGAPSFAAAAAAAPATKPQLVRPKVPDALRTTRYSIILNHSRPDIRAMLGIDANQIFRSIRAELEKVNSPLTLLAGHWSSAVINKNFILTFVGLQNHDDIAKYDSVLFKPFGPDCRGAPTAGYRSVLLGGVPLIRDSEGRLPSPKELDQEIGRNAAFKGVLSLAPPRWLYNPDNIDPGRRVSSVIIAFYDPDRKVFDLITKSRTAVAMFGSFVTAQPFENRPSFSQCSRCL